MTIVSAIHVAANIPAVLNHALNSREGVLRLEMGGAARKGRKGGGFALLDADVWHLFVVLPVCSATVVQQRRWCLE